MTDYTIFVSPHKNRKFDQSRLGDRTEANWFGCFFALADGAERPRPPTSALQTEIIHQMLIKCLNASEVNNIEGKMTHSL